MRIETTFILNDGRTLSSNSIEFREKLPISAEMLDRLANTSEGDVFELISAVANAVMMVEARGVRFD